MEGLPLALLEAMAASLPVVACAVGAIPSVVQDGRSGLLIPPRDPAALDRALLATAREPEWAADMGRAAHQRVQEHFSVEATLDQYEELYREMLGPPR
jgi:glycosyltransferase involved in cell wall biosynthesis